MFATFFSFISKPFSPAKDLSLEQREKIKNKLQKIEEKRAAFPDGELDPEVLRLNAQHIKLVHKLYPQKEIGIDCVTH